jgi:L-asparaginase
MRKIAVLSLGGTIAMASKSGQGGVKPSLTAIDLVAELPPLDSEITVETHQICNLPSVEIGLTEILLLKDKIVALKSEGVKGVVVTQGTDTIEETSWLLDLICPRGIGLVVTGAMRDPTKASADGPANLFAAIQGAASDPAGKLGALVVFNDEIHAARFVQKSHTSNVGAFTSPNCGTMGWIAEGRPIFLKQVLPIEPVDIHIDSKMPRIPIIKPSLGDDGYIIDAMLVRGVRGMVVEAAGGGHVSSSVAAAIDRAADEMPVVLSSRARAGSILSDTYGFVGSEIDLLARGVISSLYLDPLKAKLLLAISILLGEDNSSIEMRFARLNGA